MPSADIYQNAVPVAPDPVKQAATLADLAAQTTQRQAVAENTRELAQARIQTAKDQAVANAALQQANGDYRQAALLAANNGSVNASKALSDLADAKEKAANESYKAKLDNSKDAVDIAALAANRIASDGSNYDQLKDVVRATLPDNLKPLVPDQWTPGLDTQLQQMTVTGQQHVENLQKNNEFWLNGNQRTAIGNDMIAAGDDPQARQAVAQSYLTRGAPQAAIDEFLGVPAAKIPDLLTTPAEKATIAATQSRDAATAANEAANLGVRRAELALAQNKDAREAAASTETTIDPGTPRYREAQDLSDGTLTLQDFQRLHSRAQADAPVREAIYNLARTLNPNFNPAQFELGYKFASTPKVQQQIASIKNVEAGVPDILKFSDAAARSGSPTLNQYAVRPIKTAIGDKSYSNFKTATTAFADELSGALGYGSATDMSRDMGFDMTDMNQSPANFKSNIQDVVVPFVARKKASILGQMGVYGASQGGSSAPKTVTATELQAIATKNKSTVAQEKARALAAGYTVVQ